jgi:hypothetical protein
VNYEELELILHAEFRIMKTLRINLGTFLVLTFLIGLGTGCASTIQSNAKSPPPGQMKKMTGSQSAKPFAPGQQKNKRN